MNEFWGILFFLVTAGAVVLLGLLTFIARFIPDEEVRAPRDYVTSEEHATSPRVVPFSPFERAEHPQNVQPVQAPNGDGLSPEDITRVDCAARLLAAGTHGEAAAIELLFDGVKRGGSKRYATIRDATRVAAASKYAWRPVPPVAEPAPPEARLIPISEGKGGYVEI